MTALNCTQPTDSCGFPILHPDCGANCLMDKGLGPGLRYVIETKYLTTPDPSRPAPEVWFFVQGYEPRKLEDFADNATYVLNFDFRKTLENGRAVLGFYFAPTSQETAQGISGGWVFSNGPYAKVSKTGDVVNIQFDYAAGTTNPNPFAEVSEVADPNEECVGVSDAGFGICIYECCPGDCTKPYDNTVFCWENHIETPFAIQAQEDPGFAKQSYIASQSGIVPIRGIALTRSADAFNEKGQLLYSSQKWVLVWDFELNRLVDVFPAEWLRYGAAFYYQNQTLRKEIKAGCSNRKPYYLEVVDLGLVNTPQGSYNLDLDGNGQRTVNWDVPSRLMAVHRQNQQLPAAAWGMPQPVTTRTLYAEFNHVSVDAFHEIMKTAPQAQRERFFSDRDVFLNHTASQRYHDQIMFLAKETAEKTLRSMRDLVENGRHLTDIFNPEAENSFGYFTVVLLDAISKKMMRAKSEVKVPFAGFKLDPNEETSGDWLRYIYGEIRRLVELDKIDKKDFQATIFQALTQIDPANPNSFIELIKASVDPNVIKQQYDLAANARVPAGNGLTDPDTKQENAYRGIPNT